MITKLLLLSAALLALLFPNITLAQNLTAPNLGPTASFVLFTSEGPITGAGTIPFTGNIGTNLGIISGFPNLSDPLLHTQDALTAGCANYLPELFSTLKAIPSTANHTAAFADGEIITPGVYQIPIASTMAGTITLDGAGDPNAVFIFKIPGALALTAGTTIKLTNGTAASNVFWVMDGAFAAGANSVLAGTFICEAGIVSIGTGCTLNGHIFNISGAVTVTSSKLTLTNSMVLGASQSIAPGTLPANLVVTGNTTPIIKWQSSLTANFNIPTDIANTTNTLTGAAIGILPLSTYYRAVMTLDGANTGSNAAKITISTPTIAPNLGPTASFVLFTSEGIITSTGGGTFSGNIGTNAGSIIGFPNLSDSTLHTQDALTAGCANYLPELVSTLKAIPTTISNHVASFVDGEILVPGVYQIPIASTLAGTVTLDGGGNPNAVFIFKIPGALAITAASEILLKNGTAPSNVFWIMDGALAAGANSKLVGTFICEAGIVGIGTGCTLNGHIYTLAGAITVTNTKLTLTNAMLLSASQSITTGNLPTDLVITGNISPILKWQSSLTADFNNPTDIAHYTTTLSGSCIGFLDISTYFRALIVIDGAVTSSNYVKITVATSSIAPNLGPASSFVLFTSSGAIANAGISTFSGNIGTNAGIISGFADLADPKLRTQDNLTASCANYVIEIFNNVKAIPTTNTSHAAAFVDGEILMPGVYQIAIASTLAGTLTLDGGGNSNSVFVFKINGALALAAAAQIKLINGASASNVFWNINGALSAGAGAILKGIFICESGIISLGANCVLEGHAYTNFGAITLSNSVLTTSVVTNNVVVAANQSVVSGAIPANLVVTGNTTSIVRWEKSSDVLFTSPIAIANTTTILTGAEIGTITTDTYFRAVLASLVEPSYSTSVAITIAQITIPGTITANQNISAGDFPANITITGNNGLVSKWQKSVTADFANPIDISSNSNFLSGLEIGTPSETTYIRAIVQNCICSIAYTNTVTITVYDGAINSLVLTANQSIESGIVPAAIVLTGNTTPVIRWESATNSAFVSPTFISHFSSTLSGDCIGALTTTTYYRAVVATNGVNEYSNKITITVKAPVVTVVSIVGPDLGVAAQFALFTSAGAITEGGTSTTSIGKIGTAFGLLNSFPSSLSSILHQEDLLTYTCRDYLPTLFNRIKAYPTTSEHPNPAFGAGEVLTPGVYHCFMAATMSGTLTLDAKNDPNAIFIFKITGALALAANTQMVLTNGAKATNVFFAVDGALALGANCVFKGTSITYAGAIALGDSSIIEGRIFTIAGAITLANCQFTLDTTVTVSKDPVITPITNPLTASISIPGTISSNQSYCVETIPADIIITGNNGPITKWQKSSDIAFTNPTYIIASGSILTGTVMGSLSTTTYFRAEVQNCTNAVSYTNVITISIIPMPIAGTVSENQQFNSPSIPLSLNLLNSVGTILKWQKSEDINFVGLTTIDIPNTTARLVFTLPIETTTYYRAQLQGCNLETVYSDSAVVSIAATTTWTVNSGGIGSWSNGIPTVSNSAIIAGDYSEPESINTQNLTVTNGSKVIIAAAINVTLNGALSVDPSSSFTLENSANLLQLEGVANTGVITVKRESTPLYRLDFTLWSSPVSGQNLKSFSPATLVNRFYLYDSNASTNGAYLPVYNNSLFPDQVEATYNFETAKGYLIRAPDAYATYIAPVFPATTSAVAGVSYKGEFTGTPNNGTINHILNTALNGYNLVGNPYPSAISIASFFSANASIIDGTIWLWRKINDSGTAVGYASMTTMGITSVQPGVKSLISNGVIKTGQGFFVKTKTGVTTASIVFNNEMRSGDVSSAFFKTKNKGIEEKHRIWLNLSNATETISQNLVGYVTGATNEVDYSIDGKSFGNNAISLSSLVDNNEYNIQGRSLPFDPTDVVQLNFKTNIQGNYTISIDHLDGLFETSQEIFLRDNLSGNLQNLKLAAYSFQSQIGNFNSRFELVYQKTLGTTKAVFNENSVSVYKQENGNIQINSGTFTMDTIELHDISGRLIFSTKDINSNFKTITNLSISNQVLILKIKTAENGVINKKIIY